MAFQSSLGLKYIATCHQCFSLLQREESIHSDSDEEPSPEALARYLAMRRHTVGVGDSRHEAPEDVRVKLAQHQPIIAMPQPAFFSPYGFNPLLATTNLPAGVRQPWPVQSQSNPADKHFLQLPQMMGGGVFRSCVGEINSFGVPKLC